MLLDLTFGKSENEFGGILLRGLLPIVMDKNEKRELIEFVSGDKSDFIEGPCTCVQKMLEHAYTEEIKTIQIDHLVARKDFNLNVFDEANPIHVLCSSPSMPIKLS